LATEQRIDVGIEAETKRAESEFTGDSCRSREAFTRKIGNESDAIIWRKQIMVSSLELKC